MHSPTFTFCSKIPLAPQTRPHRYIEKVCSKKRNQRARGGGPQRGKIANKLNSVNGAEHANV